MTAGGDKFLIFTLQGRHFAFNLAQVAEVEELPDTMWPIPSAPACYPGAVNFHGTIVAVMDLAAFIGLSGDGAPEKMITLDTRIASLAFLVDQVVRITTIGEDMIDGAQQGDFTIAALKLPDGDVMLLDACLIAAKAQELING